MVVASRSSSDLKHERAEQLPRTVFPFSLLIFKLRNHAGVEDDHTPVSGQRRAVQTSSRPGRTFHGIDIKGEFCLVGTLELFTELTAVQILDNLPKNVDSRSLSLSNRPHAGEERLLSSLKGVPVEKVGLK